MGSILYISSDCHCSLLLLKSFVNYRSFCLSSYLLIYLQIIKRYYGGREISDEDLERALQVGMTPHERRRFEKKRGFSFKHSIGNTATVQKQDNHSSCTAGMSNVDVDTLKVDAHDGSYGNEETSEVDREHLTREDDFENSTLASDITVNGTASATSNRNMITVETTDYNESSDSAINVDDSCLSSRQENGLSEHNSKLSLLGHGPHGKRVVEYLLKEYGEDGIRAFCQRWRQVFVDAVNPRFLPGGWDVKHRYAMIISSSIFLITSFHHFVINSSSISIYFIYSIYVLRHIFIKSVGSKNINK